MMFGIDRVPAMGSASPSMLPYVPESPVRTVAAIVPMSSVARPLMNAFWGSGGDLPQTDSHVSPRPSWSMSPKPSNG